MLKGIVRPVRNMVFAFMLNASTGNEEERAKRSALQKECVASGFENPCLREVGGVNGISGLAGKGGEGH